MDMDIFEKFKSVADPEKAAPMSAYMRNRFPFLGIPTPERKKLSREYFKTINKIFSIDWAFIFKCWEQPEREYQYLAVDYLEKFKGLLTPSDIANLHEIAVTKSWWDTIDGLDAIVGDIALRYPVVNDILLEWSVDANLWLRRITIDHQLMRKDRTDVVLLEQILVNNLGQNEFFINKAIGWILRDYSKTDPDWVRNFIDKYKDKMAPLSIREASKYI